MKWVKHKNINQRVQPIWIQNIGLIIGYSTEGDYVTLATVSELLKMQESTLKSLFESMIQLDSVVKDIQEMKTCLQYTQKDVEILCILIK